MMIHQTRCEVNEGADTATFDMRVPRSAEVFRGKVLSFSASARRDKLDYGFAMRVTHGTDAVRFTTYVQPFREGAAKTATSPPVKMETPVTFKDKLASHNKTSRAARPLFAQPPEMTFEETGDASQRRRFVVRLPPYSSYYSFQPFFFETLGFHKSQVEKRIKHPSGEAMYGFYSTSRSHTVVEAATNFAGGESLALHHELAGGSNTAANYVVEYGMSDYMEPLVLDVPRAATRTEAIDVLDDLVSEGLRYIGLESDALEVAESGDKGIVFRNKQYRNSTAEIEIRFTRELQRFLKSTFASLNFEMRELHSVPLVPREFAEDPLEKSYPISLLALGHGDGQAYVSGLGCASLLCHSADGKTFEGEETRFEAGCQSLRLQLLDRNLQRIVFQDDLQLVLTLTFSPVPPAGKWSSTRTPRD
jgi:hypothetical protein